MRKLLLMLTIAAIPIASHATASGAPPHVTAQQMEIYRVRQELRAEERRLRAELKAASSLDVANIYAERLEKLKSLSCDISTPSNRRKRREIAANDL